MRIYAHDRCTRSGHQPSWVYFTLYPKGDARLPLTVQSENRPFGNFLCFAQKFFAYTYCCKEFVYRGYV